MAYNHPSTKKTTPSNAPATPSNPTPSTPAATNAPTTPLPCPPPPATPTTPVLDDKAEKDRQYFILGIGLIISTIIWCLSSPIIIRYVIPGIGDVAMWFVSALLYIIVIGVINFSFLRNAQTSGHGVGAFLIFVAMIIIYTVRAFNTDSGDSKPQRDWRSYQKGYYYLSSYHTGPMTDHWIHKQKKEAFDIKWDDRKYNHFFIKTKSGKIIYPEDLRGGKVVFSDEDIMFFNEYDEEQIISLQIR